MSRLQQASDRLKAALDRLETAAESAIERQGSDDGADQQQLESLQAELTALKADYSRLTETTETVSARLDGAVDQLKIALHEDMIKERA
ncbi:hypothetical protein LPB41_29600 [Thalassospira sp. MA62]|nr:hypothetical protein [Thalassospira sp. MA62]